VIKKARNTLVNDKRPLDKPEGHFGTILLFWASNIPHFLTWQHTETIS